MAAEDAAPSSPQCARPAIASTAATGAFHRLSDWIRRHLPATWRPSSRATHASQIMHAVALSLSDTEIATLAQYLAAQPTGINRR